MCTRLLLYTLVLLWRLEKGISGPQCSLPLSLELTLFSAWLQPAGPALCTLRVLGSRQAQEHAGSCLGLGSELQFSSAFSHCVISLTLFLNF